MDSIILYNWASHKLLFLWVSIVNMNWFANLVNCSLLLLADEHIGNWKMNVACFLYCHKVVWKSWGHHFVFQFKRFVFKGKERLIPVFQYVYDVTSMYI